jgi:hypothetical protein
MYNIKQLFNLFVLYFNPLKPKERESQKGQYKSRSKEKTSGGKARGALYLREKKEHLVRRYPGNVRSSF